MYFDQHIDKWDLTLTKLNYFCSTLSARGIDFRRQILTSKVDPGTERVKHIYNGSRPITSWYSNEAERAN